MNPWHNHTWKPIAVNNVTLAIPKGEYGLWSGEVHEHLGHDQTKILFRCDCGKLKTEILDGKWSLEEVQGGVNGRG